MKTTQSNLGTKKILWLAPLVTFAIALFSNATQPLVDHSVVTMVITGHAARNAYAVISWVVAAVVVSRLLVKSRKAKKVAAQQRAEGVVTAETKSPEASHG